MTRILTVFWTGHSQVPNRHLDVLDDTAKTFQESPRACPNCKRFHAICQGLIRHLGILLSLTAFRP